MGKVSKGINKIKSKKNSTIKNYLLKETKGASIL